MCFVKENYKYYANMTTYFCTIAFNNADTYVDFYSTLYKIKHNNITKISEFQQQYKPKCKIKYCISHTINNQTTFTPSIQNNYESFPIIFYQHKLWLDTYVSPSDIITFVSNLNDENIFKNECDNWSIYYPIIYNRYVYVENELNTQTIQNIASTINKHNCLNLMEAICV